MKILVLGDLNTLSQAHELFLYSEGLSSNLRWLGFQYFVSGKICKVFLRNFHPHSLNSLYFRIKNFFTIYIFYLNKNKFYTTEVTLLPHLSHLDLDPH